MNFYLQSRADGHGTFTKKQYFHIAEMNFLIFSNFRTI